MFNCHVRLQKGKIMPKIEPCLFNCVLMPKIEPSWIESKVPLEIILHAFTITSGYDIPKLYLSTQPKKTYVNYDRIGDHDWYFHE